MKPTTRRAFLKQAATVIAVLGALGVPSNADEHQTAKAVRIPQILWYRRTLRSVVSLAAAV